MWSSLALALRLLTVMPAYSYGTSDKPDARRAVVLFPAVGLLIGSLVSLVYFVGTRLWTDRQSLVVPALCTLAGLVITGARGVSGVARTADSLAALSGVDRIRAVALMRDPHRGAAGVAAGAAAVVLRFALYASLPPTHALQAIMVSTACGQWTGAICLTAFPIIHGWNNEEEGRSLASSGPNEFLLVTALAVVCAAVWPVHGMIALVAAAIVAVPIAQRVNQVFGGGAVPVVYAVSELGEAAALLYFTIP